MSAPADVFLLQHQFFTAASWHVFVIYACMLGCIPSTSTAILHHEAQRGLLTCLGGLAAIATSQVHARRSYLMVVLLMKRWGIRLNPAYASAEADNLFQQTKAVGITANCEVAPLLSSFSCADSSIPKLLQHRPQRLRPIRCRLDPIQVSGQHRKASRQSVKSCSPCAETECSTLASCHKLHLLHTKITPSPIINRTILATLLCPTCRASFQLPIPARCQQCLCLLPQRHGTTRCRQSSIAIFLQCQADLRRDQGRSRFLRMIR